MRIRLNPLAVTALIVLIPFFAGAQERKFNYRAVNYEVTAKLLPADQTLVGTARVEFEAQQVSRVLEVELHANLKVTSVAGADGKPLPFERHPEDQQRVRVTLPEALPVGSKVVLTLEYSGLLANEENSPLPDLRVAYVGTEGSFLLLPGRWFPLTHYPANRFTGTFRFNVPENLAVVGTGKMSGPEPAPPSPAAPKGTEPARPAEARVIYTFRVERPLAAGTFIAGNLRVLPVTAEGLTIPIYLAEGGFENAALYGQETAKILNFFSEPFGPLPQPGVALAPLPEGTLPAYSAPGLLLLGKRQWTEEVNRRALARLVAGQWWGNEVLAASPNDAWVTDGLARYCEALYVQQQAGQEGFNKVLEELAVGALTYEDAAPIAQAARLTPYSPEYNSVVVNKGALVFHMIRSLLGDEPFRTALREFYGTFAGRSASIEDFQKIVQARADQKKSDTEPAFNVGPFFANWLNSTGLPEFRLEYVVLRTQKGFRVTGKVRQELETFRMPVQIKILTDGNPEVKTIEIVGTTSDFNVETFGRPKPGGILLDPDNQILKSSPRLRVRAAIARGEQLAEAGRFYDAVQEYQRALELQKNNSLASFRMGEAFFYQKNYQAAANAFRDALDGDLDPSYRWVEVWSHIYIGKIFDLSGQRERAINEYTKARETNDNTGGALAEIEKLLKEPYKI
jgi:hypothetical protein